MLTASTVSAQCTINPRIHKITANVSSTIKSYLEFKPVDYATNPTKKYPLLIYIGGTGEMFQQPGGSDQDLCPVLNYSMPWRMNNGQFPDKVKDASGTEYSYFVVMPFVTKWEQQYNIDPGAMIDYVLTAYPNRIDINRIYLTAMSRGTDNIMGFITSSPTAAKRIAAVVPVANCFPANVGTSFYNTQVKNIDSGNVRIWGISCNGDIPCTETYIKNWVKAVDSLRPGNAIFSYATLSCDDGPGGSHHYAWNHAYDPTYKNAQSGNKNVYEWMIQYSKNGANPPPPPPPPPPTQVSCSTIVVSGGSNFLKVKGLIAPVATVQIFNSSWATVFNQAFTNSPDSIIVPSLPTGTYHVNVNFYSSSWALICNKSIDGTVGGTTPPPPPPPPPPPTTGPDCSKIVISTTATQLKLKGLIAPVIGVQVFNANWSTAFNQTYTNSPDSLAITLPKATYHVKIVFNNASWAFVCEKIQDATVGTVAGASPLESAVEMANQMNQRTIGTHMAVAPNPFVSSVTLTIGSERNEPATISVIDLSGRIVGEKRISLQTGVNRISMDGMAGYKTGTYMIRLSTSRNVENLRVIKQ
ncbi:MAG TPA: T9SS type A sorting domain-containing protein [Chitinophagaceae bacterium]|nr:T9SS type A sorting domain-containing protein [Chitinophagaceae bacterium]